MHEIFIELILSTENLYLKSKNIPCSISILKIDWKQFITFARLQWVDPNLQLITHEYNHFILQERRGSIYKFFFKLAQIFFSAVCFFHRLCDLKCTMTRVQIKWYNKTQQNTTTVIKSKVVKKRLLYVLKVPMFIGRVTTSCQVYKLSAIETWLNNYFVYFAVAWGDLSVFVKKKFFFMFYIRLIKAWRKLQLLIVCSRIELNSTWWGSGLTWQSVTGGKGGFSFAYRNEISYRL